MAELTDMANDPKTHVITVVSGLPRSGTSMMMRVLQAGSMPVLTDHIREADEDNPKGYYEYEQVKKIREDSSWLADAVGKAVKMVYRLLYDLPTDYTYRVIFMERDLREVLASQKKMLTRKVRNAPLASDIQMALLFAEELEKCKSWLKGQQNFSVLYVSFGDMVRHPGKEVSRIKEFLGGSMDTSAMIRAVDPNLYRNRIANTDTSAKEEK